MNRAGEIGELQNIRLFLGSPGGLEPERESVRRLAGEINLSLRRMGWQIEVLGWEEIGPAAGRAQSTINRDVDRADVFCGLLWDRWGTPTGEESSGFAEEWRRSIERFRRSGSPEVWLFFKEVAAGQLSDPGPELRAVLDFRNSVENEESVFYKTFASPLDLEVEVRQAILDLVISRAGLGAVRPVVEVDWESALKHEPVALLSEGQERERLGEELTEKEPARAAEIFLSLAGDIDGLGFDAIADNYRKRAASALSAAGQKNEAAALWREVLRRSLFDDHPVEADFATRQLAADLSPDAQWEAKVWKACASWPDDPEEARQRLRDGLDRDDATGIDADSLTLWRELLGQLDLLAGDPTALLVAIEGAPVASHELELLKAEANAQLAPDNFRDAWAATREKAVQQNELDPNIAARTCARWACERARRGHTGEAKENFARAAVLWGRVGGGEEEAAECFFSAQSLAGLAGEFAPDGWGWRPIVASIRSGAPSAAARAAQYEHSGFAEQLRDEPHIARRELTLAIALRRKAGHLRGWLSAQRALADCERAAENSTEAALAYCECGDGRRASEAAGEGPTRAVCDRLPIGASEWSTRASLAVLAKVGRWSSAERATAMLPELLARTGPEGESQGHDRHEAAGALAEVSFALPSASLGTAVARLTELLTDDHYLAAEAAADALRLLDQCGRIDSTKVLLQDFVSDPSKRIVPTYWVAGRLGSSTVTPTVRSAALAGSEEALMALVDGEFVAGDEKLEAVCDRYCERLIAADIGRDAKGAIQGLVALNQMGSIAAGAGSEELRREVAEKLFLYARDESWPLVNRASAVRGVAALGLTLEPGVFGERMRTLVDFEKDEFKEARENGREWFSSPGEFEGATMRAASALFKDHPPAWLASAVASARLDRRREMRIAAWWAIAFSSGLPDDGLEFGLLDPKAKVRVAALNCWGRRRVGLPPATAIEALVGDAYTEVRVALVELLAREPRTAIEDVESTLRDDVDAWVAHLARHELHT